MLMKLALLLLVVIVQICVLFLFGIIVRLASYELSSDKLSVLNLNLSAFLSGSLYSEWPFSYEICVLNLELKLKMHLWSIFCNFSIHSAGWQERMWRRRTASTRRHRETAVGRSCTAAARRKTETSCSRVSRLGSYCLRISLLENCLRFSALLMLHIFMVTVTFVNLVV